MKRNPKSVESLIEHARRLVAQSWKKAAGELDHDHDFVIVVDPADLRCLRMALDAIDETSEPEAAAAPGDEP